MWEDAISGNDAVVEQAAGRFGKNRDVRRIQTHHRAQIDFERDFYPRS